MSTGKAEPKDVEDYIAAFPQEIQEILQKIRMTIREAAPEAEETIKYQMPTFVLGSNLAHFAAFKNHIGFYPAPRGIEELEDEVAAYRGAKSSLRFPLDKPIPYDLIGRIVKLRAERSLEKAALKRKSRKKGSTS